MIGERRIMDNNFNQQQKPSGINTMELLALICSAVGTVMAIVGSALTCSCSASKTWDAKSFMSSALSSLTGSSSGMHKMSAVCILAIVGAIIAAAGVVLAIVALKQKNTTVKAGKLAYVAVAVGVFGFMYGLLPVLTICGYNCSLNSSYEDAMGSSLSNIKF